MPTERTLPIRAEHRAFTVKVGGEVVPREHALVAVSVVAAANRIASVRLSYADGDASESRFALSDLGLFVPGAELEVSAGARGEERVVFKGLVVRQRLRVRESAPPLLIVDGRHAATRLARVRRSANFFDQTDAEVIEALVGAAGLPVEVEATDVAHPQLVQHDCSDWDFINARAAANGLLVLTRGDALAVRAPALADAVATLEFGSTLLDFDGEIDGRGHAAQVSAAHWAAADQRVSEQDGDPPPFDTPGNLEPDTLAEAIGAERRTLVHAALADDEAAALAGAEITRARVNHVGARAKCHGLATVLPGDTVTLAGVGERFGGQVLVTGVRHEFDTAQGWKTHLQIGGVDADPALRQRLQRQRTASLLAPVAGLQAGVVVDLEDPGGEFRVRVRLPLVNAGDDGVWARVCALDAGEERGWVMRPEIGDEVLVGFLDDDPRQPVVLGMLHSSAKPAPMAAANDNALKGYTSRSGIELHFDDDTKAVTLATPGGNRLVLDDQAGGITIEDTNGNKIVLDGGGISIESASALKLVAGSNATLESGASTEVSAGLALKLEGAASTDVKSGGVVKVAGAAVQLG